MKKKQENIEKVPGFPKMGTGYSVPEGYFESFGERLKMRMDHEAHPVSGTRGIMFYLRPVMGLAAGLAIVLSIYLYSSEKQQKISYAQLQNESANPSDNRSETLSATLESQISEIGFFSAFTEMDEFDASKMPKEELTDYLASRCSDLEILYANK
jgi:hypothetical protein